MIYHVTYISNGLKIKGYLGIPNEYDLPLSHIQNEIRILYGEHTLPITKLTCSLQRPTKNIMSYQLPGLIYCRGGIWKVGKVRTSWIEEYTNFGYVVFAPAYQGNEGGEGRDEFGGADKHDVAAAYELLEQLPFCNGNISILGFSRGSINATQAAAELGNIQSLILWGGVSDVTKTYEERIELRRMLKRVLHGTPARNPAAYQQRSPIHMTHDIHCPVLIIHGTNDVQVDYSHGQAMYEALKDNKAEVELLPLKGYGHHLPPDVRNETLQKMFHWITHTYNRK
ncbi:alpha/beta hydrolase family protein [Ectobacillus sp. sgz5001026]|uniref:alpha/beta hydrolase family protein n=1 Tax=Ectobacillus sp. sgz5001026 TaxID=3242473 RepID=UPI0036D37805